MSDISQQWRSVKMSDLRYCGAVLQWVISDIISAGLEWVISATVMQYQNEWCQTQVAQCWKNMILDISGAVLKWVISDNSGAVLNEWYQTTVAQC